MKATMVRERASIDISDMPDVVRLVDEVARTKHPRVLRRGEHDVAVLTPAAPPNDSAEEFEVLAELERRRRKGQSVTDQTAGIFARYVPRPPLTVEEERDAFERAVADDDAERRGG